MDPFRLAELSAAGLLAQKARVETAAANLAHLHASSADPAARYRPVVAVIHAAPSGFGNAWQAAGADFGEAERIHAQTLTPSALPSSAK